jgi:flavodoxin
VLLRELFYREGKQDPADDSMEKYGRPFNHPEHLVFFKGSAGTLEALSHFKEIADEKPGATTIRRKWDGNPQVYWGRETKNGPLILAGHNQWGKGVKAQNQHEVFDFIANQSGNPKTPEEKKQRDAFAKNFANLYPLFDAATPKDFVGFVYADNLFGVEPGNPKQLEKAEGYPSGIWTFCPNPKSKTCYHVDAASELGQRIGQAQVMVVGHAYFPTFGAPDRAQEPMDDFSMFNTTPGLIVQGPIYTDTAPTIDTSSVDSMIEYVSQHGATVDNFINSLPDPDKNGIFYPFFNQMSNLHAAGKQDFGSISGKTFLDWMQTKGVSQKKQQHIINMIQQHPGGLDAMFFLIKGIRNMKDEVDAAIRQQPKKEIWDTHGEGHVRYAQKQHKYGNIKIVPTTWAPGALTA